jgi:hypothetical protein
LQVRLTQKLANHLDGVDVTSSQVGDILDLPESDARALIVEGWAELAGDPATHDETPAGPDRASVRPGLSPLRSE